MFVKNVFIVRGAIVQIHPTKMMRAGKVVGERYHQMIVVAMKVVNVHAWVIINQPFTFLHLMRTVNFFKSKKI
jgi:hypothetical protein